MVLLSYLGNFKLEWLVRMSDLNLFWPSKHLDPDLMGSKGIQIRRTYNFSWICAIFVFFEGFQHLTENWRIVNHSLAQTRIQKCNTYTRRFWKNISFFFKTLLNLSSAFLHFRNRQNVFNFFLKTWRHQPRIFSADGGFVFKRSTYCGYHLSNFCKWFVYMRQCELKVGNM